jgi:hypothetical protein
MIEINAEVILFYLLLKPEFQQRGVHYGDLNIVQMNIDELLPDCSDIVYLNRSKNDVCGAVELYPHLFRWEDPEDVIKRAHGSDDNYHEGFRGIRFDQDVPKDISSKVLEVIRSL